MNALQTYVAVENPKLGALAVVVGVPKVNLDILVVQKR